MLLMSNAKIQMASSVVAVTTEYFDRIHNNGNSEKDNIFVILRFEFI